MSKFSGLGVALVTPFDNQLKVDFNALGNVLQHLYDSKAVDYLVVLGSTGEAATLNNEEKQEILSFVNKFNKNRLPLVFGHSGNDTTKLINSLNSLNIEGYSAVLIASPAYVKPSQSGIIAHYLYFANNSPLPIILYNVPSRTASNMQASTTIELAKHKNIIAIKEASGDLVQAMEIRANTNNSFSLISGDDMLTLPLLSIGADGLISVLGNAYPQIFKEIISSCRQHKTEKASKAAFKMLKMNELMYKEGNPTGIKQLLSHLGLCEPFVRLPLSSASSELSLQLKQQLH